MSRSWMALGVAALAIAGALAIVLVLGHLPAASGWAIADPGIARRALVVHVVLAACVWHISFIVGLFDLLPAPRRGARRAVAVRLATLGVVAMTISVVVGEARPVLSNYVPVLDHGLFLAGLAAFAAGVTLALLDDRLFAPGRTVTDVGHATRASAAALLLALVTFAVTHATQDPRVDALARFERLFWGAGHLLQTSATIAMLGVWLALAHRLTGRRALAPHPAAALFAVMLAPALLGPWLATSARPHPGFTTMMQLGLLPFVVVVAFAIALSLRGAGLRACTASVGLVTSLAMTVLGFVFAAGIAGDTTLVPAHYHLNIGAVTVAFMSFLLVAPGRARSTRGQRLATWQPLVYGVGQATFATGLAAAGFWGGAARKAYGAAPPVDGTIVHAGFVVAGAGGLLALAGGAMFIALAARPRGSAAGAPLARGRGAGACRRRGRGGARRGAATRR